MTQRYDPATEYKVDINDRKVALALADARSTYFAFLRRHDRSVDLKDPETIVAAHQDAEREGVFEAARSVRQLVFGKDMHFYGVVYLWDACVNSCAYCPGSIPNRRKTIAEGNEYPLRELSVEQAVVETLSVMDDGHTHVCYLCGSAPGRIRLPDKLLPYLEAFDELGLEEVILNIEPPTSEGMRKIRRALRKTPVQFRIFQETYDRETYARLHPTGPKKDYDFRRDAQARAVDAGFDNIGLGALFGLHRFPLEEIESLRIHAGELEADSGKRPARICLPSANELRNIGVDIPYPLARGEYADGRELLVRCGQYELFGELIYALAKLAMPTISIVSSERDGPALLRVLDDYASCTTLNVRSRVGGNTDIFRDNGEHRKIHFEQTTDFPRDPQHTIAGFLRRGFVPVIQL
jgi:biotin synthase-like enzyme